MTAGFRPRALPGAAARAPSLAGRPRQGGGATPTVLAAPGGTASETTLGYRTGTAGP